MELEATGAGGYISARMTWFIVSSWSGGNEVVDYVCLFMACSIRASNAAALMLHANTETGEEEVREAYGSLLQ
eukprot:gene2165-2484_t